MVVLVVLILTTRDRVGARRRLAEGGIEMSCRALRRQLRGTALVPAVAPLLIQM
jgi:hypothetical protein